MTRKSLPCFLLWAANACIGVYSSANYFSVICRTGSVVEFPYDDDGNLVFDQPSYDGDDLIGITDDDIFSSNYTGTRGRLLSSLADASTSKALPWTEGQSPRDLHMSDFDDMRSPFRRSTGTDENETTMYSARPCLCHPASVDRDYFGPNETIPDFYLCPEEAEYCGLPFPGEGAVSCFDISVQEVVARNAWPLILLWYFGMAIICCFTMHGKTGMEYLRTRWNPDRNRRNVDELINHTPTPPRHNWDYWGWQRYRFENALLAQAAWLHRHEEYMAIQQRREQGLPPLRYEMKRSDTIGKSKDGDIVGDLQCQHTFHKSCLKSWVTRKNACPLCNVRIATRRADEPPAAQSSVFAQDQA
eukprot:CAMPEP_0176002044 /NCGR_PEP_ID=MMETSP0120_2-20121206/442_1 /TAXON_ID=160619 /ORGANISM="Kryptoperidinium foliaceum, Strain CCMP 1326" /LENGTH=358 /DNA_ID=CAMNT_0017334617 /DNA_START=99 /DNA_END=1176 /DNA_ORIENTATION=-